MEESTSISGGREGRRAGERGKRMARGSPATGSAGEGRGNRATGIGYGLTQVTPRGKRLAIARYARTVGRALSMPSTASTTTVRATIGVSGRGAKGPASRRLSAARCRRGRVSRALTNYAAGGSGLLRVTGGRGSLRGLLGGVSGGAGTSLVVFLGRLEKRF